MLFRKWLLIFSLTSVTFLADAQHEFVPGEVVTNAGDTLRGFIEQNEKDIDLTPPSVNFKTSEGAEPVTYSVDDISYFSLEGGLAYRRYTVGISMDPVQLRQVMGYTVPPPEIKPVFLQILQEGPEAKLFEFRDELKIRFYLLDDAHDQPQELVYRLIKLGTNYQEGFQFRDALSFLADKAGVLDDRLKFKISQCTYNKGPILAIVSTINGMKPEKFKIENTSGGFIAGAGLENASLKIFPTSEYGKNATSSPNTSWYVTVGYDLATNPQVGAFVFRTQLLYFQNSFETTTFDDRFVGAKVDFKQELSQKTIGLNVSALFYVVNKPNFRTYIALGAQFNHSTYDYTTDWTRTEGTTVTQLKLVNSADYDPKPFSICLPLQAGLVFNRKAELGLSYGFFPTDINQGTYPYKYAENVFRVGALYHF